MKRDVRVYHVDQLYGMSGEVQYAVFPYSLKGTLYSYFGIDFKHHCWVCSYRPWHLRFTSFAQWLSMTRLSLQSAENLAEKMRKRGG